MSVHRAVLKITAQALIHLLASQDGEAIYRVHGMPRNVTVIGCRVEHWGDNMIEILLEGDELPLVGEGAPAPWLEPYIEWVNAPGRMTGDD